MNDISLLIIGYDPYVDVWNHYFYLLNKYWPNRPTTYLATNVLKPEYNGVNVLQIGENAEWSFKVSKALDMIDSEYVVLLLEDFFTTYKVDEQYFINLVNIIKSNNIDYCKLLNQSKIKGEKYMHYKNLHIIPKNDGYGISLQPAIWKKTFLKDTVGDGNYNAWIFEFNQVKNKKQNSSGVNCIVDDSNPLEITHAIVQRKYLRKAVKVFKKQGYKIDISERDRLTILNNFKYNLKCIVSEYCPKKFVKLAKQIGKLMGVDFVSDRQIGG